MRSKIVALSLLLLVGSYQSESLAQTSQPTEPAGAAVEFVTAPDGWWEQVEAGCEGVYEIATPRMPMTQTLTVESVEGSLVTISVSVSMGGQTMPPQSQSVDFAEENPTDITGSLPPGSEVEEIGEETIEVDGVSFECTIYDVTMDQMGQTVTMRMWLCPQLPPVFMGGLVKLEQESDEGTTTVTLTSFTGSPLE